MKRLTKAEEEIMQIIWQLERCLVSDIIKELDKAKASGETKKTPHSTISSIVRILETKGFVNHKAYGRTYEYFPVISKTDYSKQSLKKLVSNYFGGSMNELVSFLVKEENLDVKELTDMLDKLEEE